MTVTDTMLNDVKKGLGIQGDYQDDTLKVYISTVCDFLLKAGVPQNKITAGIVSRGVSDIWSYGSGDGKFSSAFMMLATQNAV